MKEEGKKTEESTIEKNEWSKFYRPLSASSTSISISARISYLSRHPQQPISYRQFQMLTQVHCIQQSPAEPSHRIYMLQRLL